MLGSAAGRGTVVAFLIGATTVAGVLRGSWCRAEAFESFARTLRAPLRQQRIGSVALVIHADDDATGEPTPVEIEALGRQLSEICGELSIAAAEVKSADDLPDSKLGASPDPAKWRALLKREKVDAVVSITWKSTRSGLAVRVSLLNDRKVMWNGRARLRSKSTAEGSSAAAKSAGTATSSPAGKSAGGGNFIGPMLATSAGGWPSAAWDPTGTTGGTNPGLVGQGTAPSPGGGQSPTDGGKAPATTDLNAKILEFARSNLGRQVGDGECFELPVEAMAAAGAKPATTGNDFGQEVSLSELIPGDILQFWSARLVSPTAVWQLGEPGHNAIVGEVRGTMVSIYHQNINGVRQVRQDVLDLGSLVSGQIIGYRAESP